MKNFAVGLLAPAMSSSVVTMPGDRLWMATFLTPCGDRVPVQVWEGRVGSGGAGMEAALARPVAEQADSGDCTFRPSCKVVRRNVDA